jgi:hypothetical protein
MTKNQGPLLRTLSYFRGPITQLADRHITMRFHAMQLLKDGIVLLTRSYRCQANSFGQV